MNSKSLFLVTVLAYASSAFTMHSTDYAKQSEQHARAAREKVLRACLNPAVKISPTKKREQAILAVLKSSLNIHKKLEFEPVHHGFTDSHAPKNPERMTLEAINHLNLSTAYAQKAGIDVSDIDTSTLPQEIKAAFSSTSSHASTDSINNALSGKTARQLSGEKAAITRKENLNARAAQGAKPLTTYFAIIEKNQ